MTTVSALASASPAGDTTHTTQAPTRHAGETYDQPQGIPQSEIPQNGIAEMPHPSQDDAPVLDFETGTKRKRRIDSLDAGSNQEVPAEDEESTSLVILGAAPTST